MQKIVKYLSAIAPWMIMFYVFAGIYILVSNPSNSLMAIKSVFYYAFHPLSFVGGVTGYAVLQAMQFGVSRGVFSHGGGLGGTVFLQAANEDPPAEGAFMSAMEPFVDTIIICSVTGLVILSAPYWPNTTGAFLTLASFDLGLKTFGEIVVILSLIVFAFTTITAYAYIGEKCFKYLEGKNTFAFRIIFLCVTFVGPFLNLAFVWSLSDVIIAMIILFHLVPLSWITFQNRHMMLKELKEYKL